MTRGYCRRVKHHGLRLTLQLGLTQTIGFASTYYLAAILARPITQELGIPFEQYFLFSATASIISGLLGPILGRQIDRFGGRLVLPFASVTITAGLVVMSQAQTVAAFFIAWVVLGVGMAAGLYDAAFASVVEIQGESVQRTIAGITLIAGFASTIGWPLTSALESSLGWRGAILVWAGINLAVALPLHIWLPGYSRDIRRHRRQNRDEERAADTAVAPRISVLSIILTAVLFVLAGFAPSSMAAHLPGVLESSGASDQAALAAATLLGPGQVLARLLQVLFPGFFGPVRVAVFALLMHPLAVAILFLAGPSSVFAFAFVHGMGSGFLTVAAGILPLYLYGAKNYGERQGYIMASADIIMAFTPAIFSIALTGLGQLSLGITAATGLVALAILWWLLSHRGPTAHTH
jgi:predicted MFS family arabinose efflux permease